MIPKSGDRFSEKILKRPALLALGWAAALRRSELVSLDWQKLGAGGGFVCIDERGVLVTLMASKASQESVALIVKSRVKDLVKQRGRSEAEADELVELISGHSLRAGYATSAAARNMPAYRIQSHTRHKSAEMVAGYIREADKWSKSGLDGVGF